MPSQLSKENKTTQLCKTCKTTYQRNTTYLNSLKSLEQNVLQLSPSLDLAAIRLDLVCLTCINSMRRDTQVELDILTGLYRSEQPETHKTGFEVVSKGSATYKHIERRFHCPIFRIERNNNLDLWRQFVTRRDLAGVIEEKEMFHGSYNDNYMSILMNGFDIGRSKNGLLGVGVYFAESSTYSNSFTQEVELVDAEKYGAPRTLKNMLMCRVLTRADTGHGDDILAIRDDRDAYPEYIIYYTITK